ncbi:ankyrin repeat domain-containing protein, partial [Rhodopirellula sp. SWK7]|uniref:ankyrin repeat domain-containing protein n=1 Tax=Rhodopirellula sp. SWK7 TaxID=595460 RepID=UPI0002BFC1D0
MMGLQAIHHQPWWLLVCFSLLLSLITGCMEDLTTLKIPGVERTFHEAVGWKAEDFFNDSAVVELCNAIEANDIATMKRLIAEGVDVNAIGEGGVTPLLWAFVDNQPERFQLLLKHGADPNVKLTSDLGHPNAFRAGDTVMHLAARSQFPDHFLQVMKHGGDPTILGRHGDTVIHEIIKAGVPNPVPRIEAAVKGGADINAFNRSGYTPIQQSITRFSQLKLAAELMRLGADPTIRS